MNFLIDTLIHSGYCFVLQPLSLALFPLLGASLSLSLDSRLLPLSSASPCISLFSPTFSFYPKSDCVLLHESRIRDPHTMLPLLLSLSLSPLLTRDIMVCRILPLALSSSVSLSLSQLSPRRTSFLSAPVFICFGESRRSRGENRKRRKGCNVSLRWRSS